MPVGHDPVVLVIQHAEAEGPALIGEALERAGCVLDVRRLDLGMDVPRSLVDHAGLVVMGGPMSARSDEGFPTRRAEIGLISDAVIRGRPTLGVCLGAQLLAVATGATVREGRGLEVGWGTVHLTDSTLGDPLFDGLSGAASDGGELAVLHWHGETFDLPLGSAHLATSELYPNQAFRVGARAWGIQFHLEVDGPAVLAFVESFGDDSEDPDAIITGALENLTRSEGQRLLVLDRFAALVA